MRNRIKEPCSCCGALTVLDTQDDICPVCFWKNSQFDKYFTEPSDDNIQVTPEQARKNYREFGAFDRSALPYVREPEESEIDNDTLFTDGYPADRKPNEWYREIAKDVKKKDFFIVVSTSSNSYGALCFVVENGVYREDGSWMNDDPNGKTGFDAATTYDKYTKHFSELKKHPGEHFYRYENGEFAEYRCFDELEYNDAAYDRVRDLILIKVYGLTPKRDDILEIVEKGIKKAERTRKSLLYACKYKKTELIKQLAPTAKPTQLNKTEAYTNTAIGFCAQNDDLEGFKAMAEAGADMTKTIAAINAVGWAQEHSPSILKYIHDYYPDIFEKEVHKGFSSDYVKTCTDRSVLEMYYEMGMDFEQARAVEKGYQDPLLFDFIDNNNTVGVQFMYDKGFDLANIRLCDWKGGRNAIEEADRCGIDNEAYRLLKTLIAKQNQ